MKIAPEELAEVVLSVAHARGQNGLIHLQSFASDIHGTPDGYKTESEMLSWRLQRHGMVVGTGVSQSRGPERTEITAGCF